ncbi:MAG: phosphate ABC transporter permease subunit PstC [Chloroflexi bacterium]|nr:phosphate ABC transporter permease subunit PstC [Chloroflexota bacterium]
MRASRPAEFVIVQLIRAAGFSAIVFVGLILFFLAREGGPALLEVPLDTLLAGRWYPIEGYFGLLPLLGGTLVITLGATAIAAPLGVLTAVYVAEVAPRWAREVLKPLIELLAGIPSVALGFIGILVFVPVIRTTLGLPTGLSALTGAILLGLIAIPTIVSVAEDAIDAVPRTYRDAALALGATDWQTIWRVTVPAARTGITTAIMLGVGRAIGETMAVMMVTGNAPVLPSGLQALFHPVRAMTATIAAEMGEVANGSTHYHVLFLIGVVLFVITLAVNLVAASIVFRQRKRAERILS